VTKTLHLLHFWQVVACSQSNHFIQNIIIYHTDNHANTHLTSLHHHHHLYPVMVLANVSAGHLVDSDIFSDIWKTLSDILDSKCCSLSLLCELGTKPQDNEPIRMRPFWTLVFKFYPQNGEGSIPNKNSAATQHKIPTCHTTIHVIETLLSHTQTYTHTHTL
jgi:hypothetical protein